MDKVVLDANIFLKLLKKENDSHRAKELFKSIAKKIIPILVPHVLVNEVIHVCERDKLDVESAIALLKGLIELNLSFVPVTSTLIDRTVSITQEGHKKSGYPTFSDCMYHAIAIQENALFITADKRHYEKTKHLGNIKLLNDV